MGRFVSIFIILLFNMLIINQVEALASVEIDNTHVYAQTPFNLVLVSDKTSTLAPSVLHELEQNFHVEGQSSGQFYQNVNGHSSTQYQWTFRLVAKKTPAKDQSMVLTIKAMDIGGDKTKPIRLTLYPEAKQFNRALIEKIAFKATLSPLTGYEGQQYVLTLSLYRAPSIIAQMQQIGIAPFKIEHAKITPLNLEPPKEIRMRGQLYQVLSQRYAVYPDAPGTLQVPAILFSADMIQKQKNQASGGLMTNMLSDPFAAEVKTMRLSSKPITFHVKAKPAHAGSWLPAKNVDLTVHYSGITGDMHVGDLITRTVSLRANGVPSEALPSVATDNVAGMNVYPNKPVYKDEQNSEGIVGVLTQKEAFMANKAGDYTLPGMHIAWFNTTTGQVEDASIKPKEIRFLSAIQLTQPIHQTSETQGANALATEPNVQAVNSWWVWVIGVLLCLWLVTLWGWWYSKKKSLRRVEHSAANPSEGDLINVHPKAVPNTLRTAKKNLQQACDANNAMAAKEALLHYAQLAWPQAALRSIGELAAYVEEPLKAALLQLERCLYDANISGWQGAVLWQAFQNRPTPTNTKKTPPKDPLAPLYLHDK